MEEVRPRAGATGENGHLVIERDQTGRRAINFGERSLCASCATFFRVRSLHQVVCEECQVATQARKSDDDRHRVLYRAEDHYSLYCHREKQDGLETTESAFRPEMESSFRFLGLTASERELVERLGTARVEKKVSEPEAPGSDEIMRALSRVALGPSNLNGRPRLALSKASFGRPGAVCLATKTNKDWLISAVVALRYASVLGRIAGLSRKRSEAKTEASSKRLAASRHSGASALRCIGRAKRRFLRRLAWPRFLAKCFGRDRARAILLRTKRRKTSKPLLPEHLSSPCPIPAKKKTTPPLKKTQVNRNLLLRSRRRNDDDKDDCAAAAAAADARLLLRDVVHLGTAHAGYLLGSRTDNAPTLKAPPGVVFGRAPR